MPLPAIDLPKLRTMDTAPRDGSPFLVRYLPYAPLVLCMRRIRFDVVNGDIIAQDLGSWVHVGGIDDDVDCGNSSTLPSYSIAPDSLNDIAKWGWAPLPQAGDFAP